MIKHQPIQIKSHYYWLLGPIIVMVLSLFFGILIVSAQSDDDSEPKVQELSGILEPDSISIYRLFDLKPEQQLYVRMENTSGNLDPFIMLFPGDTNPDGITDTLITQIDQVIAEGGDPLETLPAIFDDISLIWNDDYRNSVSAAC